MDLVILSSETEEEFESKLRGQLERFNAVDEDYDTLTDIKNN
jgi:hypothetical protein